MLNPRTRDFARTRVRLIETAGQLFASRGYDGTSVDAIIRQAGGSKGAFYHHFSSKEELLDAVTDFIVGDALQQIEEAVSDRTLGATVRLNRFLNASKVWRLAHFGLWREVVVVLLRDVNAPMLRKIQALAISRSAPMLAEIIQQGVEEGSSTRRTVETARLILQLGMASQMRSCSTSSRRCRRGPSSSWNSGRSCSSPCWSDARRAAGSIERMRVADSCDR
jgi:AcrR family transcriptional regulator